MIRVVPSLISRWRQAHGGDTVIGLLKDTMTYATWATLVRSAAFFLTPLLTRRLSQDGFAVLDVLSAAQAMVVALAGLNLTTALARYFYDYEPDERRRFVSTLFWTLGGLAVLTAVVVTATAGLASRLAPALYGYERALVITVWAVPVNVVGTFGLSIFRFERRPSAFVALSAIGVTAQVVFVLLAVRLVPGSVTAVVSAQALAQVVLAVPVVIMCRGYLAHGLHWVNLRRALTFALPQFPSVLVSWYLTSANRFFLMSLSTLGAVASFAAASRLNSLLVAFGQAFTMAWIPFAMSIMRRPDAKQVYARVMYLVITTMSLATVAIALGARTFLYYYAGPTYAPAATTASLLVLSTCVGSGFSWFLGLGLQIEEKTAYVSVIQVAAFAANTALNLWLIPTWGAEGAAVAILATSVVQIATIAYVSNRFYPFAYNRLVWAAPTAAGLVIAFLRWGHAP